MTSSKYISIINPSWDKQIVVYTLKLWRIIYCMWVDGRNQSLKKYYFLYKKEQNDSVLRQGWIKESHISFKKVTVS